MYAHVVNVLTTNMKISYYIYIAKEQYCGEIERRKNVQEIFGATECNVADEVEGLRVFFFCEKTSNLFIFNHGSTMNTRNKNYIQNHRPPSDDYKHRSEPKARRRHSPSIAGAGHNLL